MPAHIPHHEIGYCNQLNVRSERLERSHHRMESSEFKNHQLYGPEFEVININEVI